MTSGATPQIPVPEPTPVTQPFWDAARKHVLSIQRCADCEKAVFYPRSTCPECGSDALGWIDATGRGTIYTYTIARRPTMRALAARVPYAIAIVELEEGPRFTTNIVDCDIESLEVGQAVEAVFEDLSAEMTLVYFRPVGP